MIVTTKFQSQKILLTKNFSHEKFLVTQKFQSQKNFITKKFQSQNFCHKIFLVTHDNLKVTFSQRLTNGPTNRRTDRQLDFQSCSGQLKKKLLGGGATIRIGREMLCLPYAGFFLINFDRLNMLHGFNRPGVAGAVLQIPLSLID